MDTEKESNSTNYDIRTAFLTDREEIIQFLYKFFYVEEPLNKYLMENYRNCEGNGKLRHFSEEELQDPTLVAVSDGKIIGVCLNRILIEGEDDSELYTSTNEIRQKFLDFLRYIENRSKFFEYFPDCKKGMTVDLISVDSAFRNKGIAKDLLRSTGCIAKEKGCGFIVIDCSSVYSAAAVESLGYKKIYSLKYEDYKINGAVFLKPDPPHVEASVYVQQIK